MPDNQVSAPVEKATAHGDDRVNQVVAEEKARRTIYLERLKNRPTFSYKAGWQDRIPAALKGQAHWIVWKFEYIDGRWTKVPYQPAAPKSKASTTEPAHWTDFATAVQVYERLKGTPDAVDGVGYVFSHGDEYVGGDLDNCFVDGVLQPWAVAYLNRLLPTYAERSPSGKGIKFIAKGTLPGTGTRHVIKGANEGAAIELYDVARFFTITGDVYGEDNDEIADRSASILEIYAEIKPPRPTHEVTVGEPLASDEVLLDKARNAKNGEEFRALYDEGAVQGSHSEADFQLCMRLAWWFNHNPEAIDRVFRASALMRPKWDEPRGGCTYGELTIIKASERVEGAYNPEPTGPPPGGSGGDGGEDWGGNGGDDGDILRNTPVNDPNRLADTVLTKEFLGVAQLSVHQDERQGTRLRRHSRLPRGIQGGTAETSSPTDRRQEGEAQAEAGHPRVGRQRHGRVEINGADTGRRQDAGVAGNGTGPNAARRGDPGGERPGQPEKRCDNPTDPAILLRLQLGLRL
jgi:hypothetical protein